MSCAPYHAAANRTHLYLNSYTLPLAQLTTLTISIWFFGFVFFFCRFYFTIFAIGRAANAENSCCDSLAALACSLAEAEAEPNAWRGFRVGTSFSWSSAATACGLSCAKASKRFSVFGFFFGFLFSFFIVHFSCSCCTCCGRALLHLLQVLFFFFLIIFASKLCDKCSKSYQAKEEKEKP